MAEFRAKSRAAIERAAGDAARKELDGARMELDAARRELEVARGESSGAKQAEAGAKASLAAVQQSVNELREAVQAERTRADGESLRRGEVERAFAALRTQLDERERNLAEQKKLLDEARDTLRDAFKATGADVLKSASAEMLKQAKEQFEGQQKLSQQELEARQKAIDATLAPLREQLAKQEALVTQLSEKREGDAKSLGEQLKQIADLQQKASSAAQTLSSALRDNRQRGRWGEVGLRVVVELAGLVEGVHFSQQETLDGAEGRLRPDMIVRLPGGRAIPIDSKVPLESYMRSLEAGRSDAERLADRRAHADALRSHVRALASKNYAAEVPGEIEFTVLYMEVESAFTAAFEADTSIHLDSIQRRVLVVTPSTLLALLRTVAMHWSNAEVTDKAAQIRDEAKELVKRVGVLVKHINTTGKRLSSTVEAFNDAVGSFDRMFLPQLNAVASIVAMPEAKIESSPSELARRVNRPEADDVGRPDADGERPLLDA